MSFKIGDQVRLTKTDEEGEVFESNYLGVRILLADGGNIFVSAKFLDQDVAHIETVDRKTAEVKYREPDKAFCRFCGNKFVRRDIYIGFCSIECSKNYKLKREQREFPEISTEKRKEIASMAAFGKKVLDALNNGTGDIAMPTNTELVKNIVSNLSSATVDGLIDFKNKLLVEMNTAVETRVRVIAAEEDARQQKVRNLLSSVAPQAGKSGRSIGKPHCRPETILSALKEVNGRIGISQLSRQYGFNRITLRKYLDQLAESGIVEMRQSTNSAEGIRGNPALPVIFVKLA